MGSTDMRHGGRSRAVYLHVGGHKTGTTFLQNVLWRNRAELRRAGVLFPGERKGAHIWASHDLREVRPVAARAKLADGAWSRLVAEIAAWDGPAIIDQELFSLATPRQIERALSDLDFATVHVVFTARDMARQLPAVWQERVKNGDTQTYADFLAHVRDPGADARRFWGMHDVPAILRKWSAALPPEQVHLVTVPPAGAPPELLWQRFAAATGLDPARYRLDHVGRNRSLNAAAATALRLLNVELAANPLPRDAFDHMVKFGLAVRLADLDGPRIGLPDDAFAWAVSTAGDVTTRLRDAGYDIVGDLADLVPTRRPDGVDPDTVATDEVTDAVVAALAVSVRHLVHETLPASRPRTGRAAPPGRRQAS